MFVTRVTFFHVQCHVRHLVTLVMSHGRSSGSLKVVPKNRGTYYAMATGRPEPRAADWEGPTWKKITLLRVIPTMTCWAEVVR